MQRLTRGMDIVLNLLIFSGNRKAKVAGTPRTIRLITGTRHCSTLTRVTEASFPEKCLHHQQCKSNSTGS